MECIRTGYYLLSESGQLYITAKALFSVCILTLTPISTTVLTCGQKIALSNVRLSLTHLLTVPTKNIIYMYLGLGIELRLRIGSGHC